MSSSQCLPCMASLIKRKWSSQHVPPCGKGIYIRWQHLIFFYLCTWFGCIKKIGQSCICWAVGPALQSNSSNCLVLIPHRQLGNFVNILKHLTINQLVRPSQAQNLLLGRYQSLIHDAPTSSVPHYHCD